METNVDKPYFCGACGITKVASKIENCGCSVARNWIDQGQCGVCGAQATMFFVHGFRCRKHEFQIEPSDAHFFGDNVVIVIPRNHSQK